MENLFNEIYKLNSASGKIDFIDNFDFENVAVDKLFLLNFVKREISLAEDEWYKIRLIDLTTELEIVDYDLIVNYLQYLNTGSFYLKLTVLDYICEMYNYYDQNILGLDKIVFLLENKYERLIVKIQACLTLMLLFPLEKLYYLAVIKDFLYKSDDYRTHIRLYNFIMGGYTDISRVYIEDLIRITNKKEFATSVAVTSILNELNQWICIDVK